MLTWPIAYIQLLTFFGIFFLFHHANLQETSTVAPCGRQPNYTYCDTFPANHRRGCIMGLQMAEFSDKAYCEGQIYTWDQFPGPSPGLTLSTFRQATNVEQGAQPPLCQIAADLYSCFDISSICVALKGQETGIQECYYDANSTLPDIEFGSTIAPLGLFGPGDTTIVPITATLTRCIRKEYRMMTPNERTRYHNALLQLKQGFGSYEYNRIAFLHSEVAKMPGAHGGPTFVTWHREYMKRLEIALRAIDPSVCLPYWDSSLDRRLSNPADSIMFSDLLMGSIDSNNFVTSGFLANWRTADGGPIQRLLGSSGGDLFALSARDNIINTNNFYNIFTLSDNPQDTACNGVNPANVLERNHDYVHVWIGGHMASLQTAPQDPIFFMHHGFIDYVWEQWRLRRQTRAQRETQFPPYGQIDSCTGGNEFYQLNATMVPFVDPEYPNWVGLSNNYTDFLYNYSLSPSCQRAGECGSDLLFCDTTNQREPFRPTCCAKIKPGGDCRIFAQNSEQPCFNSICNANTGRCVQQQQQQQNFETKSESYDNGNGHGNDTCYEPITTQLPPTTSSSSTPAPTRAHRCYDFHECCPHWAANGTCGRAKISMNTWCPGSCYYDGCQPYPEKPGCNDIHLQCNRWFLIIQRPGNRYGHTNGYEKKQKTPPPIPMNECERNPHFMARNCAKTCKKCDVATRDKCAAVTPVDYVLPNIP